jgi:hypothetical protein
MKGALYSVTLRLKGSLHAGGFPVGNILRTRRWVAGKAMWGAATASLVEHLRWVATPESYRKMGAIVSESFRFGYFFPVCEASPAPMLESRREEADRFEYLYLDTYSSTAVDSSRSNAAEVNSLHEIEFIRHYTRPLEGQASQPVSLAGYLFASPQPDISMDTLRAAIANAQIGGKRGNGYGRIGATIEPTARLFDAPIDANGVVTWPTAQPVPAHVRMTGIPANVAVKGQPEPFLGREWHGETGAGQNIPEPALCWQPGTRFTGQSLMKFQIGKYGVWTAISQ